MGDFVVSVRGLGARVDGSAGATPILHDIGFDVPRGEIVALCGPSGAGKSTIASAVAGIHRPGIVISGELLVDGTVGHVGYLPQFAAATLNPARRIGHTLGELVELHQALPSNGRNRRTQRRRHLARILRMAAFDTGLGTGDGTVLSGPAGLDRVLRRYPHEFSGGERTRLALAQLLTADPALLVLDEPTAGLDTVSRDVLVDQLDALRRAGMTMLLVTHDPFVVQRLGATEVHVRRGRLADPDPDPVVPGSDTVLRARARARAQARAERPGGPARTAVALCGVSVTRRRTSILHDVDLALADGETLGIVGVSGAGKSTVARVIAGLQAVQRGTVLVDGTEFPTLRGRSREQISHVQYVWQEAAGSFETRRSVLDQVAMTGVRLAGQSVAEARAAASAELAALDIEPGQAGRYPAGLSGGQLQRAAVARALLARPSVLVCDEVTTGLDAPTSRRLLDHIEEYRRGAAASVILISHDVRTQLDRVDRMVVVDSGRIVETGTPSQLWEGPRTAVLRRLLVHSLR